MKKSFKKMVYLVIAVLFMSVAFNFVVSPNEIVAGGISGLSVIVNKVLGINESLFIFVGNGLLFVLAFLFLSKEYALKSFIGSIILFPVFVSIIPEYQLTQDNMLAAIIGGILVGFGVFFLYLSDGSTGGTTIVGMFIHKIFKIKYSLSVGLADGIVVILGLFFIGVENTLYAFIFIGVMTFTAQYLESGFKRVKVVHILTPKPNLVVEMLNNNDLSIKIISIDEDRNSVIFLTKVNQLKVIRSFVEENNFAMYTIDATSTLGEEFTVLEQAGK